MSFDGNLYGIPVQGESPKDKVTISKGSGTFTTTGLSLVDVTNLNATVQRIDDEIFEIFLQSDGINTGNIHINSVSTAYPRARSAILRNGTIIYDVLLGVANPGTTAQLDVAPGCIRVLDTTPHQGKNIYSFQITNIANDSVTVNSCVLVVRKIT